MFISRALATQGRIRDHLSRIQDLAHGEFRSVIVQFLQTMNALAQVLAASPDLFPAALDMRSGLVTLWQLSSDDYRRSAFLDGRIAAGKPSRHLRFAELATAVSATELAENCDFIFHIGHVGSTLLSRLLGKHPALFCLREPDVLRTVSTIPERARREGYLPSLLKLWSRTYDPQARALVKATSFVSEIAPELLARAYKPRALAMGVAPEVYLATIFGGENSPAEAHALAPMRLARLKARHPAPGLDKLGPGETVALGWACESLCLAEAAGSASARCLVMDFERLLAGPHEMLARAFVHLGVYASEPEIAAILAGGEMSSYSKAPEYEYDAAIRRAVLTQGRARHADEIRRGLRWLERIAAQDPAMAGALSLFD